MKDRHKDKRVYCPKCGAVMGENVDGKPICICDVWPMNEWDNYNKNKLGNTTNVKMPK